MTDFVITLYPWIKALHVMAVISWMAGLFYLPRLFVHHTEKVEVGSETDKLFQMMEMKLFKVIMNPAMIVAWACGLLIVIGGFIDWSSVWPWLKTGCVIAMTWFHHWCGLRRKDFVNSANIRTGRQYRLMNEVPTVLMLVIVVSVIVRPF
jgi:putative membrane protein